jgi:carbon monoxide dehydrogenase subunit G
MKTVRCVRDIERPAAFVFDLLTDHTCDARWMLGVTGTVRPTPGAMHKGTRMICRFGLGPITMMKANAIIDEFEPGRRFVRRRVGGLMAMKGEFIVEPLGSAARVKWTMDVGLNVLLLDVLFDSLLAAWMQLSMTMSLGKLKALSESEQPASEPEESHVANTA